MTDKSPKKFRFTLVAKLQNNALDLPGNLWSLHDEIRAYAADVLKLEFNQKTQVFPISQGVDYLGWHFYMTDTGKVIRRLRTSNKRSFKQRLKKFQKLYSQGDITADKIKMSLANYNGHLKHGHTWKLKKKVYGDFVLTRDSISNEEKP